jgi:hypothetical protein
LPKKEGPNSAKQLPKKEICEISFLKRDILRLVSPFSVLAGDSNTVVVAMTIKPSSATPDNGKTNLVIPFGALPWSAHLLYFVQHGSGGLLRL